MAIFLLQTMTSNLPKSVRKFIRLEKARIRSQFLDVKKQEELIAELYKKYFSQEKTQGAVKGVKPEIKEAKVKPKAKEGAKKSKSKIKK